MHGENVIERSDGGHAFDVHDQRAFAGAAGQITSYVVGSNNALTAGAGSPFTTAAAPNAIATDPAARFLYVTDFSTSQVYSYTIQSNGGLAASNVPTLTGQSPSALTIDSTGKYIYVANYNANTVSGFAIDQTTGALSPLAGSSNVSGTDTGPASVLIEDASGRYVYTANFIAGTVSSLFLDPNAGTTHTGQSSPFPGVAKATAVASVKHGNPTM